MGRGRLSGIELLPEACADVIAWARSELQKLDGGRPQTEIYPEFVARLEQVQAEHRGEIEFKIPSFTAFNRFSMSLADLTQRMTETREIAGAIASKFDAKASDDVTLIAAEAIKTLIFEIVTGAGRRGINPKGAIELAGALHKANQAQSVSLSTKQKVDKEFAEKAEQAVSTVAKARGLSAETAEQILSQILGVEKPQ